MKNSGKPGKKGFNPMIKNLNSGGQKSTKVQKIMKPTVRGR